MGVCEVIKSDHEEIALLFDQLAPLADDLHAKEAMRLAARLAITVKTHALAEQRVVYEALRTAGSELAACALEGPHELYALELVLDKLLALRPGPEFRAVLAVARRLFEQHAQHESQQLFPAVQREIPAEEADQLGRDLVAEKQRVRPQVARKVEVPR